MNSAPFLGHIDWLGRRFHSQAEFKQLELYEGFSKRSLDRRRCLGIRSIRGDASLDSTGSMVWLRISHSDATVFWVMLCSQCGAWEMG